MARVLVVNEDSDTARNLASLLAHLGHDAQFASDGASALEKVREFKPQFLILDLAVPQMDALEVAQKLAKVRPKPKLVAVTDVPLDADDPRRPFFEAVLSKPVRLEQLLAIIDPV